MANIKANIKRKKQDDKRKTINKSKITKCKSLVKKTTASKSKDDLKKVNKTIDSLASKGVVHKNKANRIKSKIAKKVNAK